MKRLFISAVVTATLAACSQQPGITLSISGMESYDSVIVYYSDLADNNENRSDTVAAPNGSFFIPTNNVNTIACSIYKMPRRFPDGSMEAMSMKSIYIPVLPNAAIKVEGDFNDYTITGNSAFYKELTEIDGKIIPLRKEAFATAMASYDMKRPQSERDSLAAVVKEYETRISTAVKEYIDNNSDSDAALYALYHYSDIEKDYECLSKISERARNGAFAPYYNTLAQKHEQLKKRKEAEKKIADGMEAPHFTLKNISGEPVALSSLRGKYVVLDFWGSWCGWCIKGIPEMKKMYGKYNKRLEIVGIACRDNEEAWKKCVAENELPWTNLLNGEGDDDMSAVYAIKGYPTKIILDTDGRILKTILGESPQFYTFIDSLMAK